MNLLYPGCHMNFYQPIGDVRDKRHGKGNMETRQEDTERDPAFRMAGVAIDFDCVGGLVHYG